MIVGTSIYLMLCDFSKPCHYHHVVDAWQYFVLLAEYAKVNPKPKARQGSQLNKDAVPDNSTEE